MDCSQILPGAVSPGQCTVATGYYSDHPYIVYASGKDVVILDGTLKHLQTILGSTRGYSDVNVSCVSCSETSGRIAAVWGCDVVFLQTVPKEDLEAGGGTRVSSDFPGQWAVTHTEVLNYPPKSLSWNRDGTQLLVGGLYITLWSCEQPSTKANLQVPVINSSEGVSGGVGGVEWKEVWRCEMAHPIVHLEFSPDGAYFASAGKKDRLVKIWYQSFPYAGGLGSTRMFSFSYIAHPHTVTGFMWRHTSAHMPRRIIPNVLLTYCKDNICRLWSQSVLATTEQRYTIRFFIAASIDPISDIPFRTTLPISDELPFSVHWLNNKSTAFTNKAEKFQAGALLPMSRLGSILSFASSINEEMLQSWVCIDDREQAQQSAMSPSTGQGSHDERETPHKPHSYSLSSFLSGNKPSLAPPKPSGPQESRTSERKRALAHLMDDWNSSPDLLLCIHPTAGSLMVWTVEGLDAPPNSSRLVHVSFSSCLPHIFPPHLSQSLRQNLLQFIIKEPEAVQTREATAEGETVSDMSLPVPSIRLPGTMGGGVDVLKDAPKQKPESTLYLVSSHKNGSLNTWSVELTPQSNYSTSIAGLIHCGGTGGHHCKVHSIQRHPWLPVIMTVSSQERNGNKQEDVGTSNVVASELIIWNADLPGPLQHESRLNELSRMLSTDPTAFQVVTWVPPISVGVGTEGVFARRPSSGLFIANIGKELCLFQTSLYCITKPSSGMTPRGAMTKTKGVDTKPEAEGGHSMTVTSQLGKEGVLKIGTMIDDISQYEKIVGLHSFRLCSLVTSFDVKKSLDSKFHKDIVIVLLENKAHDHLKSDTPISRGVKTFVHMWRVTFSQRVRKLSSTAEDETAGPAVVPYQASIIKVYSGELPLSNGSHVIHSSPACDVASSLQLQLPTLSSPFLFTTASSDSTIQCWQFSRKPRETSPNNEAQRDETEIEEDDEIFEFELYEVFGLPSSDTASGNTAVSSKCLDCSEDETIKSLPTTSLIPSAISSAYPGRFALAHQLSRPPTPVDKPTSCASIVRNTLDQHAAVTIWECESSGGLKWNCEAALVLSGVSGVLATKSSEPPQSVMMDWVPMENGAYLLATCFASTASIFGMRLPHDEEEFMTANRQKGFMSLGSTLTKTGTQASWQCLVQFPCSQPGVDLIKCFAYTGSNSLVLSIGSEMHLYSCWVKEDRLFPLLDKDRTNAVSKQVSQLFHEPAPHSDVSDEARLVNLLDYAHAVNTPLPQYHPKILIELMNSGKIKSVKAIFVNVVKYLLLYSSKKKAKGNYFDEGGFEGVYEQEEEDRGRRRKRLLSVSSDGILRRSKQINTKTTVERIPHLSLAKMGILSAQKEDVPEVTEEGKFEAAEMNEDQEYDQLFRSNTLTEMDALTYGFEESVEEDISFPDLEPGRDDFTPELAKKLSSILQYAQMLDLSDLEQVRLQAIAETVANTKMSFGEHTQQPDTSAYPTNSALDLGTTAGSGYASSGLTHGVRGGEAMDDCGLRYLLALQNYITLSQSLPSSVTADKLPPSDYIWAFHSEAETELLAAIPCVQEDKLSWMELREVGVGWWLRSSDKLRLLIERLAKAQFMEKQDPLNAILFYIAMKKQSLVRGLFKTIGDQKMATFFSNDFQTTRWKKAALKNAFALLGKQRFEQAVAFFLLAGKLWDAAEVCVDRLGDRQLALVVIRLNEGDQGPIYRRFLMEFILGVPTEQTPTAVHLEPCADPFLRSIACWLLQDYSGALDTLLLSQQASVPVKYRAKKEVFNPAIFNFYFFLRSSPLLIRRDLGNPATSTFYRNQSMAPTYTGKKAQNGSALSGVGDEPLTPVERNLLFSTAYYHLCHGCPLLALNVLSKLPKSCGMGSEVCTVCTNSETGSKASLNVGVVKENPLGDKGAESLAVMIESGTIGDDFGLGGAKSNLGGTNDDEDWSHPVSKKDEEDDFDWSKPFTSNRFQDDDDEIDWSKPVSARDFDNGDLSPPNLELSTEQNEGEDEPDALFTDHLEEVKNTLSNSTLSTRGLFILSLAEQLQYNACLSILTEELITIYVPVCCQYLWQSKGKDSLPLLPLPKPGKDSRQTLASHYEANVFERTILNLRALLVAWLREETNLVKEICGFEQTVPDSDDKERPSISAPAGYDLLTTLMNYVSLHAATSPSLHTIHIELMHLMNTLLPWSTGLPPSLTQDADPALPNCAVDPSQLPILTSSSLPARHLTNLTLHLRLMSAKIVTILSEHTYPPIATQALPYIDKVFELCCALSSCMTVCLSPTRFTDFTSTMATNSAMNSDITPSPSGTLTDSGQFQPGGSPHLLTGHPLQTSVLTRPNTKPSKWPGVSDWPSTLSSDEGKDPTPLSLVLVECLVTVYLGLFSVAWSQHSITDLLLLLRNSPSGDMWYDLFGGGIDIKKDEKTQRAMSRKRLLQSVEHMAQKFKMLRRSSSTEESPVEFAPRLFVPPQKTLLDCYLTVCREAEGRHRQDNSTQLLEEGYFVCGLEEEDGDTETEDLEETGEPMMVGKGGPMFRIGPTISESDSTAGAEPGDPNGFAWCLMNLAISKLLMGSVRKVLNTAGVEVIELITASPLLYSTLKLLEEWESIFTKRLDSLGPVPEDFFARGDEDEDSLSFQVGPALTRHKSILEPDHSPFSGKSKQSRQAKHLWQFLVHREEVLETFIHYLFKSKEQKKTQSPTRSLGSLTEEDESQSGAFERSHERSYDRLPSASSECRVVYKESDSTVTSFCVNSSSQGGSTVVALALNREVIEIEIPDTSELDNLPEGDSGTPAGTPPSRSLSMPFQKEDFVMVQSTPATPSRMKRPQSSAFLGGRLSLPPFMSASSSSNLTHSQTGQNSSLLMKRSAFGVRRMAPHPTLAYYLTGSMDGSVVMWEFGNPRPVSTQRDPGAGASVSMIRFTPEGNKYGVTDNSGKLFLWQGIHTATHKPYRTLESGMKHLSDFLFLGSSSFIATCGDGTENKNVYLWDTLLPSKISIVKEFVCHEAGVASLGYSRSKQRLFCGDRRGEVLIFDLKQMTLLQSLAVHSSTINRIVVDDINGFIATGSADGDIKVLDSSSFEELTSYPGAHAKSRLFRQTEGGVTDLGILPGGRLYSCGADGSVKCQTVVL